ncbi:UxaA family hydrolase [Agaribacillus aureus]
MNRAITINDTDNVAVALTDLSKGEVIRINDEDFTLTENIQAKHKIAIKDFRKGDEIYMYGVIVGMTNQAVGKGEPITTQNVEHRASSYELEQKKQVSWTPPDVSKWKDKTFNGYHRSDGQVGTANYWLVFPLVFCENRNVEVIKKTFEKALGLEKQVQYESYLNSLVDQYKSNGAQISDMGLTPMPEVPENIPDNPELFENVDGIRFLTHDGGCGGVRQDSETLCRLLAGYVNNPNVAGATVLSLGCQNAEVQIFEDALKKINPEFDKPVIILDQQNTGTEQELIAKAIKETFLGLIEANKIKREPAPLSKLTIGLECGGSDGFSGISANPAIGYTSDLLVALGGTVILSEFPELCGVEQELINRAVHKSSAEKFIKLMRAYEKAAENVGSGFDMNPSPGNIKDGLITDAMKSAGAAKKGGSSPVNDILDYTEYATNPGLNLLCTPGNDVESTTGLAGSGANIILFTTGLGTPTGNPVTSVIKVSSNSQLVQRMPDIIDVNTGPVIEGEKTIEVMGGEILDQVIRVASGETVTKAMQLRQYDFIPWKRGVSL